ncbi:hypothetical protein [Nocardia alba]|uniref:CHAT domain-containing protein n=1 Tax=Nocardia alba TaxID=225051 RepID=A0A4R1FTR1_9NOCA|nr:hypothetical protein [Nocardia alba]TCJ97690.1 hypothetical protein DFR71_3738 [Nocardia alba]
MSAPVEVLVRAVDAGDTYLSWRWLDRPDHCEYAVVAADTVERVLAQLSAALPALRTGETGNDGVERALTGAYTDRDAELKLTEALTAAVLPVAFAAQLSRRAARGEQVRVRLTPSARLASLPWELLIVDSVHRMLEIADIVYEPPAAVHAGRDNLPPEWSVSAHRPALLLIDPRTPAGAEAHHLGPVLDRADHTDFTDRVDYYVTAGRVPAAERARCVAARVSRRDLATALRTERSRLFYFGHISSAVDEPGSAALHLHDTRRNWGMAEPLTRPDPNGNPIVASGDHRPLAAIDLLLGTLAGDAAAHRVYGHTEPQPGARLWPMPPRVALIACEGGVDYRSAETFGLVVAMVNAGAALVTTTRWTLPTNRAFADFGPGTTAKPTTELGLRVDRAHEGPDPIAELRDWQRHRLQQWQATGDIAESPLTWASLSHTIAPHRR